MIDFIDFDRIGGFLTTASEALASWRLRRCEGRPCTDLSTTDVDKQDFLGPTIAYVTFRGQWLSCGSQLGIENSKRHGIGHGLPDWRLDWRNAGNPSRAACRLAAAIAAAVRLCAATRHRSCVGAARATHPGAVRRARTVRHGGRPCIGRSRHRTESRARAAGHDAAAGWRTVRIPAMAVALPACAAWGSAGDGLAQRAASRRATARYDHIRLDADRSRAHHLAGHARGQAAGTGYAA